MKVLQLISFTIFAFLLYMVIQGSLEVSARRDYSSEESDESGSRSYERYRRRGSRSSSCRGRRREGDCGHDIDRWYYSRRYDECRQFTYRGCGGIRNNFRTRRSCEYRCGDSRVSYRHGGGYGGGGGLVSGLVGSLLG